MTVCFGHASCARNRVNYSDSRPSILSDKPRHRLTMRAPARSRLRLSVAFLTLLASMLLAACGGGPSTGGGGSGGGGKGGGGGGETTTPPAPPAHISPLPPHTSHPVEILTALHA